VPVKAIGPNSDKRMQTRSPPKQLNPYFRNVTLFKGKGEILRCLGKAAAA
jgi:hypothetical protein